MMDRPSMEERMPARLTVAALVHWLLWQFSVLLAFVWMVLVLYHTVGFRQSAAFTQWREVIGPFFQSPPNVEHFDDVTAP